MKNYFTEVLDYKGQQRTSRADLDLAKNLNESIRINTSEEFDNCVLKTIVPRLGENNSIESYIAIFEEDLSEIESISVRFILPDSSERELYFTEFELNTMLKSNKVRFNGLDYIVSESVYNIVVSEDDGTVEDELILRCSNPNENK